MEQIDLTLVIQAPDWCKEDAEARAVLLRLFPHSVLVATSYLEMDSAETWLKEHCGQQGEQWETYFYYKQSYDFGYAEYFFRDKAQLAGFVSEIPNTYGLFGDRKLRTDRDGEYFEYFSERRLA